MDLSIKNLRVDAGTGPGSRGGRIIGHTSTGKPVYANANHPAHAGFTPAEHREAYMHNLALLHKSAGGDESPYGQRVSANMDEHAKAGRMNREQKSRLAYASGEHIIGRSKEITTAGKQKAAAHDNARKRS